jgi:hypothetical protein
MRRRHHVSECAAGFLERFCHNGSPQGPLEFVAQVCAAFGAVGVASTISQARLEDVAAGIERFEEFDGDPIRILVQP